MRDLWHFVAIPTAKKNKKTVLWNWNPQQIGNREVKSSSTIIIVIIIIIIIVIIIIAVVVVVVVVIMMMMMSSIPSS